MTTTFIIAAVVLSALIIWILFFKKSTEEKDTKIDTFAPKDFKVSKTSVKKTFVVPVGSATKDEAKEAINKLMSAHKETSDLFIPQAETKAKKKWPRRKKKVAVDGASTSEVDKQVDTEVVKPKKKRGRKPKNKGGDKDQLILS
jgi:uncharacterized protein (UPF0333 family)